MATANAEEPPVKVEMDGDDIEAQPPPQPSLMQEPEGVVERFARLSIVQKHTQALPHLVLTFQDLTVYVPREKGACCRGCTGCCGSCLLPLTRYASEYFGWATQRTDPFYALSDVSGHVQTGEMLLVLSPDTQYASALIQTLTGRLSANKYSICGTVRVNGKPVPTAVQQGWRRIAAHVSADDGTHAPVLTVRETLKFAADCSRGYNNIGLTNDDAVDAILDLLDLTGVADTVVGDENVRGVSGGQKRRVTVGEMIAASATRLMGMESITDGLSSQDSFNIINELKHACQFMRNSAIVSLNQPSDEIVELFDNILVIDSKGGLAYFGPPSRETLRDLFLGPGANAALDTGSICDLCLNPTSAEQDSSVSISARFLASPMYADTLATIHDMNNRAGLVDIEVLLPKTKFTHGLAHMFKVLGKRRALLIQRNPSTYLRAFIAIFFGLVIGSLFSVLKQDLGSSLARSAYLFQNLFLVLLLSTGVTVPQNIRERITFFKHRSAEFYSSRVSYICQICYELPLSIVEAFLLSVTSYFWVDMNPNPGRFIYFVLVMIFMEFVGLALGRLICAVSRTQVVAKSVVSVVCLILATVSGFMPKFQQIPGVFRWMSWFSPPAYGFEGLALNEYVGRELSLATFSNGTMDVTVGTISGEAWLSILQLPRLSWASSYESVKAFDLIMLLVLAIAIDVLGFIFMERARKVFFSQLRRPMRESKAVGFEDDKGKGSSPFTNEWPSSLSVSEISYQVPLIGESAPKRCSVGAIFGPCLLGKKKGKSETVRTKENPELQLLDKISATFTAGRATALMGTSGAGKTTLLDVVAGYKTGGRITGSISLNGLPKDGRMWQLLSGYAEQSDILNPYLSVLETLRFTACCRLPASMNREAVINNVVELMKLEEWLDIIVGVESDGEGVPKHARKRLTIAVQLVMLPKILFLDEPTTGLGTASANLVMQAIRRCTTELKLITLATIHQPSKLIWDSFDDLLLLVKGGKTAYFGEMGTNSERVLGYFSRLSETPLPGIGTNPADYVITSVSAVSVMDAQAFFLESEEWKELQAKLSKESGLAAAEKATAMETMKTATKSLQQRRSFFRELFILTKRQLVTQWRNPSYALTRMVCSLFLAIYFGVLFIGDKSTIEGAVLTIGSVFFMVNIIVVPMQAAVVPLIADRAVLYREATSGLYSRLSYAIASSLADLPFHVLNCWLMFVGFYFLVGFQLDLERMAYFIVMIFAVNWSLTSIGQLYAVATPNEEAANGLAGLTVILSVLFMGFLIQVGSMPVYWQWAYFSDLFRYVIQGLTTNELTDKRYMLPVDEIDSSLFGDLGGNATNMFLFPSGTDISPGGVANQASAFMNIVLESGSGENKEWNNTFIVAMEDFLSCGFANECFTDPVATNFLGCFVLNFPRAAPCNEQWDALEATVRDGSAAVKACLHQGGQGNSTDATQSTALATVPPRSNEEASTTVSCLMNLLLPPDVQDSLKIFKAIIANLQGIKMVVVGIQDILKNGLPGEVILFVFGWAKWDGEELVAPYKWWYCLCAVFMFIAGIEILKAFCTLFIVWTNR